MTWVRRAWRRARRARERRDGQVAVAFTPQLRLHPFRWLWSPDDTRCYSSAVIPPAVLLRAGDSITITETFTIEDPDPDRRHVVTYAHEPGSESYTLTKAFKRPQGSSSERLSE